MFNELWIYVIVRFVDVGGVVDYRCLIIFLNLYLNTANRSLAFYIETEFCSIQEKFEDAKGG